ncbi:mucin-associated surface protein (MASP), putative [Trypanosoma cruzi marinkellei]|uniref:Mucin-associated surface protein (MASP), putative n=1 Tax=Trypanosoma cruzi marinkellei TaxID=85056 RepID=K2MY19_TRYCR|nr:mucin-associated surface protein (MASP), putative [Trypanosoma cruzi marinkellei]
MAMMMTGRVLLVCALCVLWCGGGGIHARDLNGNAQGDCMASGVLGVKKSFLSGGCGKKLAFFRLRPAFFNAIQAEEKEVNDVSQEINNLGSDTIPPPQALSPVTEKPEASPPPPPGASHSEDSDRSQTGGGGSSGVSNGDDNPTVEVSVHVDNSASSNTNGGGDLQNTGVESATQKKNNSSETDNLSGKTLDSPALPKLQNPELPDLGKSKLSPNIQEVISVDAPDRDASGSDTVESDRDTKDSPSVLPTEKNPTGETLLPVPSTGESPTTKTTAPNDSENPREKNENTTTSGAGTESEVPKTSSKNDLTEQNSQERVTPVLTKSAATNSSADSKTSSTSASRNGDAQGKANENGDDPDGDASKGTHDDPEDGNTNFGPTASDTGPEAVNNTETNDTTTYWRQ